MMLSQIALNVIHLAKLDSEEGENPPEEQLSGRPYNLLPLRPGPTKYRLALRHYLPQQPRDVIYFLMTIMYLGRDNRSRKVGIYGFRKRYKEVRQRFPILQEAVDQVIGKAQLSDQLEAGLRVLATSGIDVDTLLQEML